jgi:hypothetical protein
VHRAAAALEQIGDEAPAAERAAALRAFAEAAGAFRDVAERALDESREARTTEQGARG